MRYQTALRPDVYVTVQVFPSCYLLLTALLLYMSYDGIVKNPETEADGNTKMFEENCIVCNKSVKVNEQKKPPRKERLYGFAVKII